MADKWFLTAAFKGGSFESNADVLVSDIARERHLLADTDVFYTEPERKKEVMKLAPGHILVLENTLEYKELEKTLLAFPGRDFTSRLGHDVINLFSPLSEYSYLSKETILARVEKGGRMGQQINFAGHLMQNDILLTGSMTVTEFLFHIKSILRQENRQAGIVGADSGGSDFSLPPEKISSVLIREIIFNWKLHSSGHETVVIDKNQRKVSFLNSISSPLNLAKPKACLRRPFYKGGHSKGNGLGFFVISLCGLAGGFDWDVEIKESSFCLSLFF